MTYTIGIDIGSGAVKTALFRMTDGGPEWLAKRCERIRRRDPMALAQEGRDERMNQAEKKAAALPPKLTVPMILFFLPVLLIVILVPAAIQVFKWT